MRSISSFFKGFHGQSLIFYEGKQARVLAEVKRALREEEGDRGGREVKKLCVFIR